MNDLHALAKLIHALDPWRDHLVFIGGWAHRLYRFDPRANELGYQPIFTRDTDLAIQHEVPLEGDIKAALVREGFKEELAGEHRPPVAHYTLGDDGMGFYAEFLTPLHGSGIKRNGAQDATTTTAGISAQKIRHLDVLLVAPWVIEVGRKHGVPLSRSMDIQVANPTSFMVQKFLIHEDRPADKRAQDLLYVHDAIELFGGVLPQLKVLWQKSVGPALGERKSAKLVELILAEVSSVSDTMRNAARIPQDRRLSPEKLQAVCKSGLTQILT